jgi:hypothetical protein
MPALAIAGNAHNVNPSAATTGIKNLFFCMVKSSSKALFNRGAAHVGMPHPFLVKRSLQRLLRMSLQDLIERGAALCSARRLAVTWPPPSQHALTAGRA